MGQDGHVAVLSAGDAGDESGFSGEGAGGGEEVVVVDFSFVFFLGKIFFSFFWEIFLHGMVLGFSILGMLIMILDIDSGTWSSQSIQMSSINQYTVAAEKST